MPSGALRDRPYRIDVYRRLLPGRLNDEVGDGGIVIDGAGVGHGQNGSETSGSRCPPAALNGLGVFAPGFAKMRMQIDQTGSHHQPGGVQDLRFRGLEVLSDRGHAPLLHQQIGAAVHCLRGIDDAALLGLVGDLGEHHLEGNQMVNVNWVSCFRPL